jgi:hypothetical protein
MNSDESEQRRALAKAVALLQFKLLLDALRDLALAPLALIAAAVDFVLIPRQPPRWFRAVLRIGEHSDRVIDVWSGGRDDTPAHTNVDTLLAHIEQAVRDPQTGARRARILKRWAERQITRGARGAMRPSLGSDRDKP